MNVVDRFLARAAGAERVHPGDKIRVRVDLALAHDGSAPTVVSEFARTGAERVFAGDRVVFCFDQALPAPTVAAREGHRGRWSSPKGRGSAYLPPFWLPESLN